MGIEENTLSKEGELTITKNDGTQVKAGTLPSINEMKESGSLTVDNKLTESVSPQNAIGKTLIQRKW